jgi:cytochrome c1
MQARHVSAVQKDAKGRAIRGSFSGSACHRIAIGDGRDGIRMADKDGAMPAGAQVSEAGKARKAKEDARLAAALRANLARRKQQTRERADGEGDGGQG